MSLEHSLRGPTRMFVTADTEQPSIRQEEIIKKSYSSLSVGPFVSPHIVSR